MKEARRRMSSLNLNTKHLMLTYYNKYYSHTFYDILNVYGNVSTKTLDKISVVKLTDIDHEVMVISFNMRGVELQIDKPILITPVEEDSHLSIIERVNEMIIQSATKRGLSLVQMTETVLPYTLADFTVLLVVPIPVVCYFQTHLLAYIPILGPLLYSRSDILLAIIGLELLCHMWETYTFLRPRLAYYRVPTDFLIEWYLWGILEGYSPVRRLNEVGSKKEQQKIHKLRTMKEIDLTQLQNIE